MSNERWDVVIVVDGFGYVAARNVCSGDAMRIDIDAEIEGWGISITPSSDTADLVLISGV